MEGGKGGMEGGKGGRKGIKVEILYTINNTQCACLPSIQAIKALPLLPHLVYLEVGCSDQVLLIMGPGYVGEDVFK